MKQLIIILLLCANSYLFAQEFDGLNDSLNLKRELFELAIKGIDKSKYRFVVETHNAYSLRLLNYNKKSQALLSKHFPIEVKKIILKCKPIDIYTVFTDWSEVFDGDYPDSTIFIWNRRIDDFFYEQDSVGNTENMYAQNKFSSIILWYINPDIFRITSKGQCKTYAILSSHFLSSNYPEFSNEKTKIDLYERKNNTWVLLETLYSFNPYTR